MSRFDHSVSCTWVREAIDTYLDDGLDDNHTTRFETHLVDCARCRQELSVARNVLEELRALPTLKCPDHVKDRVFEHVDASAARVAVKSAVKSNDRTVAVLKRWFTGRYRGMPRPALAGVIMIVVIVSSLVVGRLNRPMEQITPAQIGDAEAAVKRTFAYVNQVSRRSGLAVRDEVFGAGVTQPVQRAVRSALDVEARTQQKDNGGSV